MNKEMTAERYALNAALDFSAHLEKEVQSLKDKLRKTNIEMSAYREKLQRIESLSQPPRSGEFGPMSASRGMVEQAGGPINETSYPSDKPCCPTCGR